MSEERCDWSDLLVSQCSHCLGLDTAHDADLPRLVGTPGAGFEAAYSGRCAHCDEEIVIGSMISRLASGEYVHYGCHPANQS